MNENAMNKPSETDLAIFDAMSDDQIDTSDIPPLSEQFFAEATWQIPDTAISVTIKIEPDIFAWFQAQGEDYQHRLTAALRLYVEAHRSFANEYPIGSVGESAVESLSTAVASGKRHRSPKQRAR